MGPQAERRATSVNPSRNAGIDINNYFDVKVCINLDRRPDRWRKMVRAFSRHRIENVVRFPAFDGSIIDRPQGSRLSPGEYGCLLSHLAVVKEYRGAPRILIFEDDCLLVPHFAQRFALYAPQLPAEWHLLMFGDHRASRPGTFGLRQTS